MNCSPYAGPVVFFDLETTGLDLNKDEIIQIGAKCGDHSFWASIVPRGEIPWKVTEITGLRKYGNNMINCRNEIVQTVPMQTALTDFLHFLSGFGNSVILVAHNCRNFDGPLLMRTMKEFYLFGNFKGLVYLFSDTLPMFRVKMPGRWDQGSDYKQPTLAREILGITEGYHDALDDANILQELASHPRINFTHAEYIEHSFRPQ